MDFILNRRHGCRTVWHLVISFKACFLPCSTMAMRRVILPNKTLLVADWWVNGAS